MNEQEIIDFINDPSKRLTGDILWSPAPDNSLAFQFSRIIDHSRFSDISLVGWSNPRARKVTFSYISRDTEGKSGRIYGLCVASYHEGIGPTHKHGIRNGYLCVYKPQDITASGSDAEAVWRQFCAESLLTHNGWLLGSPEGS